MSDLEINYDLRPYIPDIYINDNIYNSFDCVNNNNNIGINSTIFIFNINEDLQSPYNDPLYLLFGVKKENFTYEFPSLNFDYLDNQNNIQPSIPLYEINNNLKFLLESIGYNVLEIKLDEFQYQELFITKSSTEVKNKNIYLYFNLKNPPEITNYNNYASSVYYENKYWNIIIYPFVKINTYIQSDVFRDLSIIKTTISNKVFLDTINFDDRENIKYYEKIDYKYFENIDYTLSYKSKIETLKNYSLYIKNYTEYINTQKDKIILNFNLNEISKLNYPTTQYNQKNINTYTNLYLNNKHINNYKCYSSNQNKYSFSSDNKISNLNFVNTEIKNYSCYNYDSVCNSTNYQQFVNFFVNGYYDYSDIIIGNNNSLTKINIELYKIFLFINPKIIDKNYLLDKINTRITPLFKDSNNFQFGTNNKKLNLYIVGNIKPTNLYYLNKFKIEFEFSNEHDNSSYTVFNYIIILGIVFYDSNKLSILNTNSTYENNELSYINYSIQENYISLSPTVFNFNKTLKIYGNMIDINITNIKKFIYNLDYTFISKYKSSNNFLQFINFYSLIPNYKTENNIFNMNNKNQLNVILVKINNFIRNFININDNINNFRTIGTPYKTYLNYSILYDENIIKNNFIKYNGTCYCNYDYKSVDCNNENDGDSNIYIEYVSYFPKIEEIYLGLDKNFIGKYSYYLSSNLNMDSEFIILPAGKYVKFNYINYIANYPTVQDENFVKSVKNLFNMVNYNFSLWIMIPFNINLDDNFYCSNPKYYWTNQYSANIGDNHSKLYLVLNDKHGNPYTFYGEYNNNTKLYDGIIYGIQLFNNTNFLSENLKLYLKMNLYYNKYINFTQLIFLSEFYEDYSDKNNMLWNINDSYLKLHNLNHFKDILMYDYKRFKNCNDMITIKSYIDQLNYVKLENLYQYKVQLNNLRYNVKIYIWISNLIKTTILLKKCYNYCEIIRTNIMMNYNKNDLLITIVKYNISIISNLYQVNYDLDIYSGTLLTEVYAYLSKIYLINDKHSLEDIFEYQNLIIYIINYSRNKINVIINLLNNELKNENNLFYNLYTQIYSVISFELINSWFSEEINNDIENFIHNTDITIFNNYYIGIEKKALLLQQVNAYLKIIMLNITKIDELMNLAKLMGDDTINNFLQPNLNLKVVKNTYIYNTECYLNCSNVPVFNIINFLKDMKELIIKLSIEINNPNYLNYKKAIQQGVLTFIDNTIQYFKEIINEIIYIYKYERNIPGFSINIYNTEEIGKFYIILTEFDRNYNSLFNIIFDNQINTFNEYTNLKNSFNNLSISCQEYLLFVRIWNDFMNTNLNIFTNAYVNEDLYKIIKTDTFYDFMVKTIQNFQNTIIKKNPNLLLIYLETITLKYVNNINNSFIYYVLNEINSMISGLKEEINTGIPTTIPNIMFASYYIIPYEDLLLFKGIFLPASFNFFEKSLVVIQNVDELNATIFQSYYDNPDVNTVYVNALGYTYLSTPFKYVNINNDIINA
jgi:hypothetical protein